jgi:cathepsin B
MCGCCWAFAGAEAASDRLCISTNGTVAVPLSAQDVCFGASFDGCDGGQIDTPWQYISSSGAVTGGQVGQTYPVNGQAGLCSDFTLPHCHHHGPQGKDPYPAEGTPGCEQQSSPPAPNKCDANAKAPHNDWAKDKWSFSGQVQSASGEEGIQKAIMEGGPVETAFTVYPVVLKVGTQSVLLDGVLMLVPSTGKLPTHGTRTGVKTVTSVSNVVTVNVVLKMV